MTIEEKAKRYDEVFNAAKEWYNNSNSSNIGKSYLYAVFPELKENEDERIRLAMIKGLSSCGKKYWGGFEVKAAIAWLEKQGEQKPQGKSVLEAINEENVDNVNKVEPKFKIGDWVVKKDGGLFANGNHYVRITDIDKERYWFDSETWLETKYIRLWNISDAKVGDVLATKNAVFIVKYIDHTIGLCKSYCDVIGNSGLGLGFDFYINSVHPATKEQRDELEKAMTDAGYTFDFEKKELKRIEDETEIPYGAKDSELMEASYYIPKGFHAEIDRDKVVIKKGEKPTAWSEEDNDDMIMAESMLSNLIVYIRADDNLTKAQKHSREGEILWLVSWLKSLKDKYTWKPSDEQMEVLLSEVTGWKKGCSKQIVLESLYNDLKKLK